MVVKKSSIVALYASMLAIANIAAVKIVSVGSWEFTAGVIPIAVCYLLSDIGVEKYGREFGHRLVWSGVMALTLVIAITQLVIALPGTDGAVDTVLGGSFPILIASVLTITVSQHIDVFLFTEIRNRLPYRVSRNIGSTSISQLLDTTLFTVLAFAVLPAVVGGQQLVISTIITIILTEWVVKLVFALLDTPVFLATTSGVNDGQ